MSTIVRVELTPSGEGTLLRLRHSGFTTAAQIQAHRGWPQVLGWLHSFIEKGETVETRGPFPATPK